MFVIPINDTTWNETLMALWATTVHKNFNIINISSY
jgi:hypothetical protein